VRRPSPTERAGGEEELASDGVSEAPKYLYMELASGVEVEVVAAAGSSCVWARLRRAFAECVPCSSDLRRRIRLPPGERLCR
jgi:hypothetical protein